MIAYWANLDKYCDWSITLGEVFNSYERAETYCSEHESCIGFCVVEGIWRSCPRDSKEVNGKGLTLYKKGNLNQSDSQTEFCAY